MMPFAETFTILANTLSGQDADGNDIFAITEISTRGAFAPSGSSELVQGRAMVITHDTIYLEAGQPIPEPQDQMRVRGIIRDVDGTPEDYTNPFTGWHPGPVVRLVEVTG